METLTIITVMIIIFSVIIRSALPHKKQDDEKELTWGIKDEI